MGEPAANPGGGSRPAALFEFQPAIWVGGVDGEDGIVAGLEAVSQVRTAEKGGKIMKSGTVPLSSFGDVARRVAMVQPLRPRARPGGTSRHPCRMADAPPSDWVQRVNLPITAKEKDAMQLSIRRCRPFGSQTWTNQTVADQHLEHTCEERAGRAGRSRRRKRGKTSYVPVSFSRPGFILPVPVSFSPARSGTVITYETGGWHSQCRASLSCPLRVQSPDLNKCSGQPRDPPASA